MNYVKMKEFYPQKVLDDGVVVWKIEFLANDEVPLSRISCVIGCWALFVGCDATARMGTTGTCDYVMTNRSFALARILSCDVELVE